MSDEEYANAVIRVLGFLKVAASDVNNVTEDELDLTIRTLDLHRIPEPNRHLVIQGALTILPMVCSPVEEDHGPRGSRTKDGIEFRSATISGEICK